MSNQNDLVDTSIYISKFLVNLYEVTGFTKAAFTTDGLKQRLKIVTKRFYQLNICDSLLKQVMYIAKILSDSTKTFIHKSEACVKIFVDVLEQVALFLFTTFIGRAVVLITASMSNVMTSFIIGLYYFVCFLYNNFSCKWFTQLKNYLVTQVVHSDKFLKFFDSFECTKYAIQ